MINIDSKHLELIKKILIEHVPDAQVLAFGSRVTGTVKNYSDFDIAIKGNRKLDIPTLGKLKNAFEESTLPFRVDVIDWQGTDKTFQDIIKKNSIIIQEG